ncbi:MAG: sulfite exporter TauE/SafE family protein [Pseudomonadota bacterium]
MFSYPPEIIALALAAFLIGGFAKGVIGLGLPVVVLAIIAAPMGVANALAVFVIPAVLANLWQALDGTALRQILARLWPFYLAAAVGVMLGGQLVVFVAEAVLLTVLGTVLITYSALALASPDLPQPGRHEPWMAPAAALSGGIMFGLVGNFIVPGILYLQALRLPRDVFVQALGVTFIVISSSLGLSLSSAAVMTTDLALLSAACAPLAFLGMALGRRLRKHVSEDVFRKVFLTALILTGVYMIWQSVGKL